MGPSPVDGQTPAFVSVPQDKGGRSVVRAKPLRIGNDPDRYLRGVRFQESSGGAALQAEQSCETTQAASRWV